MIIDFHTHIFPDALAPRALGIMRETSDITPANDGTASGLLASMRRAGVGRAVVLNSATNTHQVEKVNAFAAETAAACPQLYPFGSLHPQTENPKDVVRSIRARGLYGLKLHCDYVRTPVDDASYRPIFAAACEYDLPVVIHAGYDPVSPDFVHATPDRILKVLEAFPALKLVCAHFGGYALWDEVAEKLCGRNLYLDTSLGSTSRGMTHAQAQRILDRHDPDKILFGSDLPWCREEDVRAFLGDLDISDENREKLEYKNAMRLLQISQ